MKKITKLWHVKMSILYLLMFCFTGVYSQNMTYTLDDPEDVRNVIYKPGDVVIIKNGTYTTDERIQFLGSGTAENPVTLRAETPGGVIFTGGPRLTIGGESDGENIGTGEYLIVDGFHWKGGYGASNFIEFRNGYDYAHHSTIQNCVIDGLGVEPSELQEDLADEQISKHRWVVLYGTYNSVINCSFMNKVTAGAIVLGEYSYNAFPNVEEGEEEYNNSCAEVGHTVANNYFYNYAKMTELYGTKADGSDLSNAGDCETIRMGTSSYQMVNSNATIVNNYFVQSDGENEIITNKSKGNTYRNNTFRRCRGSLVLRHGSYATVEGNYFLGEDVDGTGGVRITDSEHTITNNYIQDCITVGASAKWNNGITFIGGSANEDVACTSDNVSNGYQKTVNIDLSNNTIVNTNAPLFYNVDKGSTDPTGNVKNNLIYFSDSDPNLTDVISGDTETSYNDLGKALTYSGNVYNGTSLGESNVGFSEEISIVATADGEIFSFSGSGSEGKGANMGSYEPTTDADVGYGVGACFVDYTGAGILDGDCTIEIIESLSVSSLPAFSSDASSADVTVTANVSWTAVANDDWISIDVASADGNATVEVSVVENTFTSDRTGTVTFTQDAGGDDIVRTLYVNQDALVIVRTNLINTGAESDPVSVHSWSSYQESKSAHPNNTLDKDDGSLWTAEDGAVLGGDFKGDGEFVIYDLGNEYELDFIQFKTNNKSDPYGFQIWVSTTTTEASEFTMILPTAGSLLLGTPSSTEFNQHEIDADARYIKLVAFGRYNSEGTERKSQWSSIAEIEFYGDNPLLAVGDVDIDSVVVYPIPAKDYVVVRDLEEQVKEIEVYSVEGGLFNIGNVSNSSKEMKLDTSNLSNGVYILKIVTENNKIINKRIVIVR